MRYRVLIYHGSSRIGTELFPTRKDASRAAWLAKSAGYTATIERIN